MATYRGDDTSETYTGPQNVMYGLGGNDYLRGNGGYYTVLYGGEGNDTLLFQTSTQTWGDMYGGSGNDSLYSDSSVNIADYLHGDTGNDYITSYGGNDFLDGGIGNDLLFGGTGNDELQGGSGVDGLVGGTGDDVLYGGEGDDAGTTIVVGSTDFQSTGGLFGEAGLDYLDGGRGNDLLDGGADADILLGGEGNDTLIGGTGIDRMDGGFGNDKIYVDNAADVVIEAEGGGTDQVLTTVSYQLKAGVAVETLSTTSNVGTTAINLVGNDLVQTIIGNNGVNTLNGLGGNDTLSALAGNDFVYGGLGNDTLFGGTGNDSFVFNTALNATTNRDTIRDFHNVSGDNDTIRLENAIFTKLTVTGGLSSANFAANANGTAVDANDYIVYNTTTGALSYDSNGSAAGGLVQFATLSDVPTLTSSDFLVI